MRINERKKIYSIGQNGHVDRTNWRYDSYALRQMDACIILLYYATLHMIHTTSEQLWLETLAQEECQMQVSFRPRIRRDPLTEG